MLQMTLFIKVKYFVFLFGLASACEPKTEGTLPAGSLSTPPPPPPVLSQCGHSSYYHSVDDPGNGVVGGQDAYKNQFPWVVSILFQFGHACVGSIINSEWILTAAHCARKYTAEQLIIVIGDHYRVIYDLGEKYRSVSKIVIHPEYETLKNDFALLKMSAPLTFESWNVQPICLPTDCNDGCQEGQHAYVAGWGLLDHEDTSLPYTLQVGLIGISSLSDCVKAYANINISVNDLNICATVTDNSVDSCKGDSGGPLMVNEDGYYKICGVISFGFNCAEPGFPGVYARVCSVAGWIDTVAFGNSTDIS